MRAGPPWEYERSLEGTPQLAPPFGACPAPNVAECRYWARIAPRTVLARAPLLTLRVTPAGHVLLSEKLLWLIGHQQNDLSYAAILRQHLCLSRIAQRKPATDWQNELPIAQVVCKFTHL